MVREAALMRSARSLTIGVDELVPPSARSLCVSPGSGPGAARARRPGAERQGRARMEGCAPARQGRLEDVQKVLRPPRDVSGNSAADLLQNRHRGAFTSGSLPSTRSRRSRVPEVQRACRPDVCLRPAG